MRPQDLRPWARAPSCPLPFATSLPWSPLEFYTWYRYIYSRKRLNSAIFRSFFAIFQSFLRCPSLPVRGFFRFFLLLFGLFVFFTLASHPLENFSADALELHKIAKNWPPLPPCPCGHTTNFEKSKVFCCIKIADVRIWRNPSPPLVWKMSALDKSSLSWMQTYIMYGPIAQKRFRENRMTSFFSDKCPHTKNRWCSQRRAEWGYCSIIAGNKGLELCTLSNSSTMRPHPSSTRSVILAQCAHTLRPKKIASAPLFWSSNPIPKNRLKWFSHSFFLAIIEGLFNDYTIKTLSIIPCCVCFFISISTKIATYNF